MYTHFWRDTASALCFPRRSSRLLDRIKIWLWDLFIWQTMHSVLLISAILSTFASSICASFRHRCWEHCEVSNWAHNKPCSWLNSHLRRHFLSRGWISLRSCHSVFDPGICCNGSPLTSCSLSTSMSSSFSSPESYFANIIFTYKCIS